MEKVNTNFFVKNAYIKNFEVVKYLYILKVLIILHLSLLIYINSTFCYMKGCFFMDLNEYIDWYQEHFGISPSQKLIEKFISVNHPLKMETKDDDNKKGDIDNK